MVNHTKYRTLVTNISLLFTVSLVTLLCELMLRVYIPQPGFTPYSYDEPKGLWINDMETGFRYSPNYSLRLPSHLFIR